MCTIVYLAYPKLHNVPNVDLKKPGLGVLLDVDVDGEMGVDVSHLVPETFGHTNDQIVEDSLDCSQRSHVLTRAMVKLNVDGFFVRL